MRIYPGLFRTFGALQRRRLFLQAWRRESLKMVRALGRILFSSQAADELSLLEVATDDVR
jgi:hypothetical protein